MKLNNKKKKTAAPVKSCLEIHYLFVRSQEKKHSLALHDTALGKVTR